jgi:hypothetical protein
MLDTGTRLERNRVHIRRDTTNRTVPVNDYLFFSADGSQPSHVEEQRTDRTPVRAPRLTESPSRPSTPEPLRDDEDMGSFDAQEEEERQGLSTPPRPPPSPQRKRRVDREQLFLQKSHVSRVGRESKKVVPFDPSN